MPKDNTIAKNTVFLTLQTVFVLFVSLYTSRVILKVLGVEDFGVFNVVGGFVSMFAFLNTSMINGIQRFYNYELGKNGEAGLTRVYNTALVIQALLGIFILLLTETFGLWYINEVMVIPPERIVAARYIFHFSVVSLFIMIMQIPYTSAIIAHEHMGFYALVNVFDTILKLAIALAIPYIEADKLVVYGFLIFMINVINWLLYFAYSKFYFSEIKLLHIFNYQQFKEMLCFSGWNMFGSFSGVMKEQGINMILNLFFGPVVNAARGIAYQVTGAMQGFVANVNTASRPQLTQSYASGDLGRSIQIMYSMSKLGVLTLTLLSIPVIFEIDYILDLWLDTEIPLHTNTFVQLVVLNSLVLCLNPPVSFLVHATGKMRNYQMITSIFALLILPLSYLFLHNGASPEFVFVLLIIFTILGQILCVSIVKTLIDFSVREYMGNVITPLFSLFIAAPIFPLIPRLLMEQSFIRLVVVCIVSSLSTSIIGYYVVLNKVERDSIISFLKFRRK